MEKCKVSVIIPCFNSINSIDKALKSVLQQKIYEIEILCVDDCSVDGTWQKIVEYQKKDHRIKVISLDKNHGVGYARNIAIQQSRGEYISFLDSDDQYIDDKSLFTLFSKAKQLNADMCGGNSVFYDVQDRVYSIPKNIDFFREEKFIKPNEFQFYYGFWRFLFKKDFLTKNCIYFPELKRFQDPPFFIESICKASKVLVVTDYVYLYSVKYKAMCSEDRYRDVLNGIVLSKNIARKHNLKGLVNKLYWQATYLRMLKLAVELGVSESLLRRLYTSLRKLYYDAKNL